MNCLLLAFGLSLAPTLGFADSPSRPQPPPDARLVPVLRDGNVTGLKVYAIRPQGRFARAHLENGDTIERIDDLAITTDAGARALHDKLIAGSGDATLVVRRHGQLVTLTTRGW